MEKGPPKSVSTPKRGLKDTSPRAGLSPTKIKIGSGEGKPVRSPPKRKTSAKATPAARKLKTATVNSEASHILLIDNGGDKIKFGWKSDKAPRSVPNVTARLQQQWTVLVADQLAQMQNPNQLIGVTRSTERGIIVNMGNQVQVWIRILDIIGVNVGATMNSDLSRAFGRQTAKKSVPANDNTIHPNACAVVLTVPPLCPRVVLDQMMMVWMEDFGFAHVGFYTSPLISAGILCQQNSYETACVVDLGWSATNVICTHRGNAELKSIRRMPIGGRHLIKIWQYHCSYRQWNLMDQEFILRKCLEQTGFVSLDFKKDMDAAAEWPVGMRPHDMDFILPDYQNTFEGQLIVPPALERRLRQQAQDEIVSEEDDEEDDEDVCEEDMNEEDIEDDGDDSEGQLPVKDSKDDDEDGSSDGEEDEEMLRKRLLKEREEAEMRKKQFELEQQVLHISVERFAIPEALFRPSDVGLPKEWAGLAQIIQQSIEACPAHLHGAMYQSVYLVGGLAQLQNLKTRLETELRALVPCEYDAIKIEVGGENPEFHSWFALQAMVQQQKVNDWAISREEWLSTSGRGAWRRLSSHSGGSNIV